MKRLALSLSLFALLLLTLASATEPQKASDEAAVRATVTDYIEGYYTGDAMRMEKSLHPHYLKHTISGSDADLRMTEKTACRWCRMFALVARRIPPSEKKRSLCSTLLATSHPPSW